VIWGNQSAEEIAKKDREMQRDSGEREEGERERERARR